ncbi:DNA polymerase [bacterium]|nr:DNA polymerase [bacterium]
MDKLSIASSLIRSVLTATPGRELVCADFANIEGRVQAWVAGESWKLQAFREYDAGIGPDLYKLAFHRSFGTPVEEVSDHQRQVGKVQELALGYGGGISAFASMAGNYGMDLEELADLVLPTAGGEEMEGAEWMAKNYLERVKDENPMSFSAAAACDILKRRWRTAHPNIVSCWRAVEDAALITVSSGQPHAVGALKFGMRGSFLHMLLPGGRLLAMMDPEITEGKYGGESLTFKGVDAKTSKFWRKHTYGGDLFQSAIQAIARDIMGEAMLRVEDHSYQCIMTVHDEIVAEGGDLETFKALMATNPQWAQGLPIAVDGWQGRRYRK